MAIDHTIGQGECIDSIAMRHGFFPETLWNHGANAKLKELRKDPNVLYPGDKLFIPDLRIREVEKATEQRHRFRRKGVPAKLHLRFLKPKEPPPPEDAVAGGDTDDDSSYEDPEVQPGGLEMEPIANAPYRLDVEGETSEGQTDGDGQVRVSIPPNAALAIFTFHPDTEDQRVITLELGKMDPVETMIGVRKRLSNLGYRCLINQEGMTPELRAAVGRFQIDNDLDTKGGLNDATRAKLKEKHGC